MWSCSAGHCRAQLRLLLLSIIICSWLANFTEAQSDLFSLDKRVQQRSNAGQYCGSRLSEALKVLCNGSYNSYFKAKKSSPDEYWTPPVQLPFRERLRAAAFLESRSRFTRGVFDECCTKSCTINELMSYCAH